MNLHEFLDSATFEGNIFVAAWDDRFNERIFEKFLDEFRPDDTWVYSWRVGFVCPIETYRHNVSLPCILIEVLR